MAKTKKEKAPKKAAKPVVIETPAQHLDFNERHEDLILYKKYNEERSEERRVGKECRL